MAKNRKNSVEADTAFHARFTDYQEMAIRENPCLMAAGIERGIVRRRRFLPSPSCSHRPLIAVPNCIFACRKSWSRSSSISRFFICCSLSINSEHARVPNYTFQTSAFATALS